MIELLWTLLGAVLGLLLTLIFQPLVDDRAALFVLRILGTTTRKRRLSLAGQWDQRWVVQSEHFPPVVESKGVLISQFGKRIQSQFSVVGTNSSEPHRYLIVGEIEQERFVTGTWFDAFQGATYSGAFQLKIHLGGESMSGKWIGFGESGEIKGGDWEWKRPSRNGYPSEKP